MAIDVQTLSTFFMWCTLVTGALYIFTVVVCISARDWVYRIQNKWFPMPRETFNVVLYCYIGLFKVLFIMLNIVPFVALSIMN